MSTVRAFLRSTSGAAAAELALLVPLLVLMMFSAIEVGYYFYSQHEVVKGVRDGARYASRQSFTKINCVGGSASIDSGVVTDVKEVTRTGQVSGGTPRIPGWTAANVQVTASCAGSAYTYGIYRDEPAAPVVTVRADVDYNSLFDGVGILTDNYDLNAVQQAAVMGI